MGKKKLIDVVNAQINVLVDANNIVHSRLPTKNRRAKRRAPVQRIWMLLQASTLG
jgi:hypothetical protein